MIKKLSIRFKPMLLVPDIHARVAGFPSLYKKM